MFFSTIGESPTIHTKVHATLASLVKKYLSTNSVRQDKVRTLFDPENLPSSTLRIPQLLLPLSVSPLHQLLVLDLFILIDYNGG